MNIYIYILYTYQYIYIFIFIYLFIYFKKHDWLKMTKNAHKCVTSTSIRLFESNVLFKQPSY